MHYLFILFLALSVLGIVSVAALIEQDYKQKQEKALRKIATKLNGTYQANDPALASELQRLITGPHTQYPQISHAMRFRYQQGEIVIAEYSHMVGHGKQRTSVHHAIIAIPQREGEIPIFNLRKKQRPKRALLRKKWADVSLEGHDRFNKYLSIKTWPDDAKVVARFFAEQPQLAELCLAKKSYRLVSNGKWLLFYNPSLRLAPKAEHYSNYLGLAQQLYRITWPDDGWQLKSVSTDGAASYEDYLKSLKEKE